MKAIPENIILREAAENDFPEILRLKKSMADYYAPLDGLYLKGSELKPGVEEELLRQIKDGSVKILVLEKEERLIGYVRAKIKPAKSYVRISKTGHISEAYIEEAYRKRGLVRKMLEAIYEWFRGEGVEYAELTVDVRNRAGLNSWEALGFEPVMLK